MARVSITKAAKLAGISRNSLYKTYIDKGVISVSSDASGKKFIDTSEILRVFGELQGDEIAQQSSKGDSPVVTPVTPPITPEEIAKDVEIKLLREQLEKSEQREQRLLTQMEKLTDTVKLLESPKHPRLWYQFWK